MTMVLFIAAVLSGILVILLTRKNQSSPRAITDTSVRTKYAKDISIFSVMPKRVYFPETVAEVQEIVRTIRQVDPHATLSVRAGGTCMSGGSLTEGSVIDLGPHFSHIEIDPVAQTATVGAGAMFRDIEDAAALHGLMFAPYPSSRRICGIGGMIGNNASGEKSIRFGATGDNILSLEVVLADGSVVTLTQKSLSNINSDRERSLLTLFEAYGIGLRDAVGDVVKAASGYRLDRVVEGDTFSEIPLFAGAQGTLGIVTKATLRLVPVPQHLSLIAISAERLDDIPVIVAEIGHHHPEAIETFDKHTFARARVHLKEAADALVPYVVPSAELFILAEFSEDSKEATEQRARDCAHALQQLGYVVHGVPEENAAKVWEVRRNAFLLMRDHNEADEIAVPCIEDVIVPLPTLGTFIRSLEEILVRRGIQYGFHGHIGDGSFRIVPIFKKTSPTLVAEITGLMEEVFTMIKALRGNISADHSDGIIRTPFLRMFYGEQSMNAFAAVKQLYDPNMLFNPGKKICGSVHDIERFLDRT